MFLQAWTFPPVPNDWQLRIAGGGFHSWPTPLTRLKGENLWLQVVILQPRPFTPQCIGVEAGGCRCWVLSLDSPHTLLLQQPCNGQWLSDKSALQLIVVPTRGLPAGRIASIAALLKYPVIRPGS